MFCITLYSILESQENLKPVDFRIPHNIQFNMKIPKTQQVKTYLNI